MTDATKKPDTVEAFRKRAAQILNRLKSVVERRPCSRCDRPLWIILNTNGKREPITNEMTSHFSDCPHAGEFRR